MTTFFCTARRSPYDVSPEGEVGGTGVPCSRHASSICLLSSKDSRDHLLDGHNSGLAVHSQAPKVSTVVFVSVRACVHGQVHVHVQFMPMH